MKPVLLPPIPTVHGPPMSIADHPVRRVRAMLSGDARSNQTGFGNVLARAIAAPTSGALTVPEHRMAGLGSGETTLGDFIASLGGTTPAPIGSDRSPIPALSDDWAESLPPVGRPWADAIEEAAVKAGVDPRLLAGLVWAESEFEQGAVSSAGALGLTQLMPATAEGLDVDPTDPIANLEGGARFLRAMLDKFGSVELALAAYNAGPNRVADAGGMPDIPSVPIYVGRVLGYAASLGYSQAPALSMASVVTPTQAPARMGVAETVEPVDLGSVGEDMAGEGGDVAAESAEPLITTSSRSVPVRAGNELAFAKPGMAGAMVRLARVIEELQSAPPPRRISVEIPELGGIRVSVTLIEDGVRLHVPRAGVESERLARDLADALRQRGFDLSGDGEGSPPPEQPLPWTAVTGARSKTKPVDESSGWLL